MRPPVLEDFPMKTSKTLTRGAVALAAACAVAFGGTVVPAQAAPLRGASWVASPNGVVGVQQMVILRAPIFNPRGSLNLRIAANVAS